MDTPEWSWKFFSNSVDQSHAFVEGMHMDMFPYKDRHKQADTDKVAVAFPMSNKECRDAMVNR